MQYAVILWKNQVIIDVNYTCFKKYQKIRKDKLIFNNKFEISIAF